MYGIIALPTPHVTRISSRLTEITIVITYTCRIITVIMYALLTYFKLIFLVRTAPEFWLELVVN